MYKVAILDDEKNFLEEIHNCLQEYEMFEVSYFQEAKLLIDEIDYFDVVYIDYEMENMTAFEFFKETQMSKYIRIIITKYDHIVYKSIDYDIFDFIRKKKLKEDIKEKVINRIIPEDKIDKNTKIYINPTGSFIIGGPLGDTGLTGRKIIMDTYGGYSRHGGGAFSGKDGTKVDRSAAYMSRHIAKNIVANELAEKCEIQLSYGIGIKEPISIFVNTFGTGRISEEKIVEIIKNKFDLTPQGIIKYLKLDKPIFSKTTNYGHFGKNDLEWEKIISKL